MLIVTYEANYSVNIIIMDVYFPKLLKMTESYF